MKFADFSWSILLEIDDEGIKLTLWIDFWVNLRFYILDTYNIKRESISQMISFVTFVKNVIFYHFKCINRLVVIFLMDCIKVIRKSCISNIYEIINHYERHIYIFKCEFVSLIFKNHISTIWRNVAISILYLSFFCNDCWNSFKIVRQIFCYLCS